MNQRHKPLKDKLLVFLFLGFLGGLTAWGAGKPPKGFSESENRYLQKKPEFTVSTLMDGSYGRKYEKYLSDQFPGRDGFIGGKVLTERLMLREDVNGVYFGRDGYLMEKFDTEQIEGDRLQKNLLKLADFTAGVGEFLGYDHVRVMLVPSVSQVMTERLPFLSAPYDQSRVETSLNGLLKIRGVPKGVNLPVGEFLRKYRDEPLYYRTDHHWTGRGAFLGYQLWAGSIGVTPWETKDFDITQVSESFHGSVYSKLNIPWRYDSIEAYQPKLPQNYEVSFDGEEKTHASLYFYHRLREKDQYAFYLDGNHAVTKIVNESITGDRKDRRLLIVKDSYAHSFAVFAANHFGTVVMVDLRYLNKNLKDLMEEHGITDVLTLYEIPEFAKEKTVTKLIYP